MWLQCASRVEPDCRRAGHAQFKLMSAGLIAIGVALGVAIGAAMGNVTMGIGVGLAIGIAGGLAVRDLNRRK